MTKKSVRPDKVIYGKLQNNSGKLIITGNGKIKCVIKEIYQNVQISGESTELSADYFFNLRDENKYIKKGKVKFQFINLRRRKLWI